MNTITDAQIQSCEINEIGKARALNAKKDGARNPLCSQPTIRVLCHTQSPVTSPRNVLAMVNALVLVKMDRWITDEMRDRIRATSLSNAKQLIGGTIRDHVIVDVAATTAKDLNGALAAFTEISGVKSVTLVQIAQES